MSSSGSTLTLSPSALTLSTASPTPHPLEAYMTFPIDKPDEALAPLLVSLAKLDSSGAHYSYYDPRSLRGINLILDTIDFRRLGSPGYLRLQVEVVDPEEAFQAHRREMDEAIQ